MSLAQNHKEAQARILSSKVQSGTLSQKHSLSDIVKQDALTAAAKVADALATHTSAQVSQAFQNQKEIEAASKRYKRALDKCNAQTRQWISLMSNFHNAIKELGDLEHGARFVMQDVQDICKILSK